MLLDSRHARTTAVDVAWGFNCCYEGTSVVCLHESWELTVAVMCTGLCSIDTFWNLWLREELI